LSCSLLTPWLCFLNYLSCGNVIYGISCLCSFSHLSCGNVNYGTLVIYLICMYHYWHFRWFHSTPHHFLKSVLSCSFFTLELEVPPSSTLFFFLRTLFRKSATTFFLFSSVVYISSWVLLTLGGGFYGLSFWCTNTYWKIFANTNVDWHVSPLFSLTYLYHLSNWLHKLLNIICAQSTCCPFFVLTNVITFLLLKYCTFSL
jgi:hypothetical protein